MTRATAFLLVVCLSLVTGLAGGIVWKLGNAAAAVSTGRLIIVAIPTNFIAAAGFYYVVRGATGLADGGLAFLCAVIVANFLITLPISAQVAGALFAGGEGGTGAQAFSWGLSYAYGQAFHDVRAGTWLHED